MEFRRLKEKEIEVRVATVSEKGCSLLLYKDARVDQNMLDEAVGPMNWQRTHEVINGNLFCNVGIRDKETGEWVWKQDVGTESYAEKEKGQASDAFKRACFNWGIGRELYTAPSFMWFKAGEVNVKAQEKGGRWTTYDKFRVIQIVYAADGIAKVEIKNMATGITKTFENTAAVGETSAQKDLAPVNSGKTPTGTKLATERQLYVLRNNYQGEDLSKLLKTNNIQKLEELPMETASSIISKLKGDK